MVTPTKGGGFACDSNCPNWKSLGLCSHTVAVAQVNGKLEQYISLVKKTKRIPNVIALVTSTMPKGQGKKGGVPSRSRKPVNTTEACTRVAMNVGTQVVSNVQSIGTTAYVSENAPTNFNNQSATCYPPSPCLYSTAGYHPWSMHTPMYSYSPHAFEEDYDVNPFTLTFIKGNISICIGCKNRYERSPKPPSDLCIRHKEWREFTPTGCETPQSKFSNVYYHCMPQCVWLRCPYFNPSFLETSEVADELTSTHKEYLTLHFRIVFD